MISPDDVADDLGRDHFASATDPTYRRWERWIAQARMLIRIGDGAHAGLGDLALLDQEILDYVTLQAVVAHVQRPDDATVVDVSVDDSRVSKTYTSGSGRVTIRPEWWSMLAPEQPSTGAFTVRPYFEPDLL